MNLKSGKYEIYLPLKMSVTRRFWFMFMVKFEYLSSSTLEMLTPIFLQKSELFFSPHTVIPCFEVAT